MILKELKFIEDYIEECSADMPYDQKPEIFKSGDSIFLSDWDELMSEDILTSFGFVFENDSGYYRLDSYHGVTK